MTGMNSDVWNIGTLHKEGIWGYYVLSNYVGVFLCSILMYSVWKNPKRNATDVIVCGLCSACLILSITCGTQCLVNVFHKRFYGGELACQIEAIAHVSSILTQFFCVAALAIRSYLVVVRKYDLPPRLAAKITAFIWVFCTVMTGLFSLVSPIYLMSNGAYCFFAFGSFAIAGWLLPGLVLALGAMTYCYYQIWRKFRETQEFFLGARVRILGSKSPKSESSRLPSTVQPQPQTPKAQPQPQTPTAQSQPQTPVAQPQPQTPTVQPQPPIIHPQPPPAQPQADEQWIEMSDLKSAAGSNDTPRPRIMTFFGQVAHAESARKEVTHMDVARFSAVHCNFVTGVGVCGCDCHL